MATIQSRNRGQPEPLSDRDHGCVDCAQGEILVQPYEFRDTRDALRLDRDQLQLAAVDGVEERGPFGVLLD
ncbi:hypothetical protein ABH927_000870 [Planotetraspora sp. GP83]